MFGGGGGGGFFSVFDFRKYKANKTDSSAVKALSQMYCTGYLPDTVEIPPIQHPYLSIKHPE